MKGFMYCALLTFVTADISTHNDQSTLSESSPPPISEKSNLWMTRPTAYVEQVKLNTALRPVEFRPKFSVSRLAKSFNFDYDMFFSKDAFLPFETRRQPVKVLSFKKNRIQTQTPWQDIELNSNAAEKQSPYNEIIDT